MCRELGLGNSQLPASGRVFSPRALPDGRLASALQPHLLLQGGTLQQGEVPWVPLANLPSAFQSSRQADLACSGQVSRQQANQASLAFTVSVFLAVVQAGNAHTQPPRLRVEESPRDNSAWSLFMTHGPSTGGETIKHEQTRPRTRGAGAGNSWQLSSQRARALGSKQTHMSCVQHTRMHAGHTQHTTHTCTHTRLQTRARTPGHMHHIIHTHAHTCL